MYPDGGAISTKRPPSVLVSSGTEKASLDRSDGLRSCEAKLLALMHNHWALEFGSREVRLVIEYQDKVPVLIRIIENVVKEEKLK